MLLIASAYPPDLPRRPTSSLDTGTVYLRSNSAGRLEIGCTPMAVANRWRWLAAIAMLAIGVMLEVRLRSKPGWLAALCERPHALALGVGAIWWSLLAPSAMGLLIVLLTLYSLALGEWRKHHPRQPGHISTQLTARVN